MKNPYFDIALKKLQQKYQLDMIHDVLLGKTNRIICYAEVKDVEHVFLNVISGTLEMIGLKDQERIAYDSLLQLYDPHNSYANMASVKNHLEYIHTRAYSFHKESSVTLPIITDHRRWITIDLLPIEKTKEITVVFITEVTDGMNQEEQNYDKSNKDSLTGLFNRYALDYHYGERYKWPHFHVLYLDLDDFKRINDTYGHGLGNTYLTAFSAILRKYESEYNLFYRLGGDEFVGLFWEDQENVKKVAQNIIEETRKIRFLPDKRGVSVSIGIMMATARDDVIRKADQVLYEAKSQGKNRFIYRIE